MTKYKKEYVKEAEKLAKLGATDNILSVAFGVNQATIWRWKEKYPEFNEGIERSRQDLDNRVATSLFQRAVGYTAKKVKLFYNSKDGTVIEHHYEEDILPDIGAQKFWLMSRRPEEWREVHQHDVNTLDDLMKEISDTSRGLPSERGNEPKAKSGNQKK
jgi:uncharacterized protein YegJ (DUF2314 family)